MKIRPLLIALPFLTLGTALADMPSPDDPSPQCQANKKVAVAFMQAVFVDHKVKQAFDEYVGSPLIENRPMGGTTKPTRAYMEQALISEFAGGKGPTFSPVSAIAEGDLVFVKSSNGDLDVFRIKHGKIVEHWQGG